MFLCVPQVWACSVPAGQSWHSLPSAAYLPWPHSSQSATAAAPGSPLARHDDAPHCRASSFDKEVLKKGETTRCELRIWIAADGVSLLTQLPLSERRLCLSQRTSERCQCVRSFSTLGYYLPNVLYHMLCLPQCAFAVRWTARQTTI